MREVTLYIAWDDSEFDTREACEVYEKEAYDTLVNISQKYNFFDADMNMLVPPTDMSIEMFIQWLDDSTNECAYIRRVDNLTEKENKFLRYESGYCITNHDFNNDTGLFKWDGFECEWIKVGE